MSTYDQRFPVRFQYPVVFTQDVFSPANSSLRDVLLRGVEGRPGRVLVTVDRGLSEATPGLLSQVERYFQPEASGPTLAGPPLTLPGGEEVKNSLTHVQDLIGRMHELGMDRHCFVLAVGGGALLDMAGFAAALVHRGMRLVRVPSTVLSQADSGVGVKNGINAFGKKNFLGTFVPPFAVVNDGRLLRTLQPRDRISGMSEAVKVALVRDAAFFDWLGVNAAALRRGDPSTLDTLVRRSAELHLAHIAGAGDPFELGSARPLDFGHWSAHKLESLTHHRLRHGEAVAMGMALDTLYSEQVGLCSPGLAEQVLSTLESLGLTLWDAELAQPALLEGLEEFRQHLGGELTVTLLRAAGQGVEVHEMRRAELERARDRLRARAGA